MALTSVAIKFCQQAELVLQGVYFQYPDAFKWKLFFFFF